MTTEFKKHYCSIYYTGDIFEYSKEPKDGFEKHESSTGNVSYRKYYRKGVEGNLQYISLRKNEKKNNAEELVVRLSSENDSYYLTFNVMNTKGDSIDEYTEALLRVLPKMEKGQVYNINNWRMNKGDVVGGKTVEHTNSGVTVKTAGTKIEPVLTYKTEANPNGDIPRVEWKEVAGKPRPSAASKEAKLEYLYTVLQQQVERLKFVEVDGYKAPETTAATQPAPEQTTTVPVEDTRSKLPF